MKDPDGGTEPTLLDKKIWIAISFDIDKKLGMVLGVLSGKERPEALEIAKKRAYPGSEYTVFLFGEDTNKTSTYIFNFLLQCGLSSEDAREMLIKFTKSLSELFRK